MPSNILKKGQLKILVSVIVLIFFTAFAFMAFGIYSEYRIGSAQQQLQETSEEQSIEIASIALGLPEIRCSLNNHWEHNCVDKLKIRQPLPAHDDYPRILGFSTITVDTISGQSFDVYTNPLSSFRAKEVTVFPVNIYDPVTVSYEFGTMTVEVYS